MTTKIKIYIAITAGLFFIIACYSIWSNYQMRKLETGVNDAKALADDKERRADELERAAHEYKEKIAYLEANLDELQTLARKQDEELKSIETTTGNARRDVERARSIRTAAATAEELCRKLAELGHPCD
jgi:predicted RNase H-like nuclease (RuvC/YqgF family)